MDVRAGHAQAGLQGLDALLELTSLNPQLYRPSAPALEAIRALIRAQAEVHTDSRQGRADQVPQE